MIMYVLGIYALILFYRFVTAQEITGYTFKAAESWSDKFPNCKEGDQSPIDISFKTLINMTYDPPFIIHNEEVIPNKMTLYNVGTGLKLVGEWPEGKTLFLTGGPIAHSYYNLEAIWIFWNRKNKIGSAHSVEGISAAIEIRADYYRWIYKSIENAQNYPDGIVSLSSLWAESELGDGTALDKITSKLSEVIEPGTQVEIEPFKFQQMRENPGSKLSYFAYNGSQITPPCAPTTWVIVNYPYPISADQIKAFQTVKFDNDDENNLRPRQLLNGRKIYQITDEPSEA